MSCEIRASDYHPVLISSRMRPSSGDPQPPYDYPEYSSTQYSQQQQQQQFRGDAGRDRPSTVNTLGASTPYYHPLSAPLKHASQQSYYEPSSLPVTTSHLSYALEQHKPSAAYHPHQHHHHQEPSDYRTPAPTTKARSKPLVAMEAMCDVCRYPDPILVAPDCRHTFHSRCVHMWPLHVCPVCAAPLDQVAISPSIDMMARPEPRSGKWTRQEENFIDVVLREFDRQALPLAHGTPIRLVLAKMLNCSTMRLSKKFQKNALGKRTFRVVQPAKGKKALQFDPMDHVRRQRELSQLEQVFRQELIDQFQRENNTNDGALVETQCLRVAVQQFWVSNLLRFAVLVGQPVMGLDVSDAKKRKRAMQLLRNGQYDELLSWHPQHLSRGSTGMTPMPPVLAATSNDMHSVPTSWNAPSAAVYASSVLGHMQQDRGVCIPALVQQLERPVKKKRTPEVDSDGGRFGLTMDQSSACLQYGRISPRSTSVSSYEYNHQQQEQQEYQSEPFGRPSSGSSPYSEDKTDKETSMGYANGWPRSRQQDQQLVTGLASPDETTVRDQRTGFVATGGGYPRPGDAAYHVNSSGTAQVAPWDGLLEIMSSEVPGGRSISRTKSHLSHQCGDPAMHSWSTMHMM